MSYEQVTITLVDGTEMKLVPTAIFSQLGKTERRLSIQRASRPEFWADKSGYKVLPPTLKGKADVKDETLLDDYSRASLINIYYTDDSTKPSQDPVNRFKSHLGGHVDFTRIGLLKEAAAPAGRPAIVRIQEQPRGRYFVAFDGRLLAGNSALDYEYLLDGYDSRNLKDRQRPLSLAAHPIPSEEETDLYSLSYLQRVAFEPSKSPGFLIPGARIDADEQTQGSIKIQSRNSMAPSSNCSQTLKRSLPISEDEDEGSDKTMSKDSQGESDSQKDTPMDDSDSVASELAADSEFIPSLLSPPQPVNPNRNLNERFLELISDYPNAMPDDPTFEAKRQALRDEKELRELEQKKADASKTAHEMSKYVKRVELKMAKMRRRIDPS